MNDSNISDDAPAGTDEAELQKMTDRLKHTLDATIEAVTKASAQTIDAAKDAAISADEFVQDNPWLALIMAAGVAGAVGYFVGRASVPKRRYWLPK
jgi:ElaB/YqjD/DUF883 family membrane-anchored ribosome-binding protein